MNKEEYLDKLDRNLARCAHFDSCSQNLCPLDFDLHLRVGGESDKCRWMREGYIYSKKGTQLKNLGRYSGQQLKRGEFLSGGRCMPRGLLKYVPKKNVRWLNKVSQKRWHQTMKR